VAKLNLNFIYNGEVVHTASAVTNMWSAWSHVMWSFDPMKNTRTPLWLTATGLAPSMPRRRLN